MAIKLRVAVEIEGASPGTFKMEFEFSDEEGSDIEFYSNHDLPEDVSEKLGAISVEFTSNIRESRAQKDALTIDLCVRRLAP
jgi:hypothetical protein